MARLTATDRLTRLLAMIPHVAGRGFVSLDEIAARFAYPRAELVADLTDVLPFVGVAPFTPDTLIEVAVDDDRVKIDYADWFVQPLRLAPEEALALYAAGRTLVAAERDDTAAGPLLRGLTKLGAALGSGGESTLDIHLGAVAEETLATMRDAVDQHRRVRLDYYSYGRDRRTERVVEPHRFFNDEGNWYVAGHCHRAGADRVFRVDRIREATLLDETFPARDVDGTGAFAPRPDDPRVVLELEPSAGWVATHYPNDGVTSLPDGRTRVVLVVTATPWLARLLLQLGPSATVIEAGEGLDADVRNRAARRILARYTASGTSSPGRDPEQRA